VIEQQKAENIQSPTCDSSFNILNSLMEGCQIISPDWRYLYVNDAVAQQGRCSTRELLGKTMMDVFPGIENTTMFAALRQCMEDRLPRRMENEFTFSDGRKRWFELRMEAVPEGVFILSLDITAQKKVEEERKIMLEVLQLVNSPEEWEGVLKSILKLLRDWSGCEAVGIRIKEGEDFPYFETSGFPEEFVRLENQLCLYDENGEIKRDSDGNPILECMCGNILCERFDASKSFFTADGCFWSNCTTELLASTTDADRQARTRNRCNGEGYESVALIPLRSGGKTFGLIQFNDRREGRFTSELIALYRRIANHVANFLARKQAEEKIVYLNKILRGIRSVNQLIVREKDQGSLIRQTCEFLVEAGGFSSVAIGLLDDSVPVKCWLHASEGEELPLMQDIAKNGIVPERAHLAMASDKIIVWKELKLHKESALDEAGNAQTTMLIGLNHKGRSYGFMIASAPDATADSNEGQELLKEIADDIALALHSVKLESERDNSAAELSEAQEQLRQIQKLDALGRLAGGIAHDFNNILMVQIGYCELMEKQLAGNPMAKDLAQVKACSKRAAGLTRQLLAFSRKQTLMPEVLDLNKMVKNIEKMLRRLIGENIEFELLLAEELGRVKADPGQIEQVIMNLAVNARDAMPHGGRLTIATDDVFLGNEYAVRNGAKAMAGSHVALTISDTGVGMDAETKVKIFEPFFTTKPTGKGTGLGLATVYGIIKQSGGNILFCSEPGAGSTFKIYLPRVDAELTKRFEQKNKAVHGNGELALVVEDEKSLRELFLLMLDNLGYRGIAAADGFEALEAIEKKGVIPHFVIADLVMPGMSGKALAERLIQIMPDLKVLYTSGYAEEATALDLSDGKALFLRKPFNISDLASKIHELLNKKSPSH
jgi:PAS domain S-box-containing protein